MHRVYQFSMTPTPMETGSHYAVLAGLELTM